jgi:CHASE2 domain-containing sensor protein
MDPPPLKRERWGSAEANGCFERMGSMTTLKLQRERRIAVCLCVLSISLMGVVTMARSHLWVSLACVGVEVVVVVMMMLEVAARKRETSGVKLWLDE